MKTWKDGLDQVSIEIAEKMLNQSFNGVFRNGKEGSAVAFARVERTEYGFNFSMLRMYKDSNYDDIHSSLLHLYRRDNGDLVETVDVSKGAIHKTVTDGFLTISMALNPVGKTLEAQDHIDTSWMEET